MVIAVVFAVQLGLTNGEAGQPPLYYSANYCGDDIFALVVAFHFLCCALLSKRIARNLEAYKVVGWIRWLASHTFSLYVYHMPILYFIRAVGKYDPRNRFEVILAVAVALIIIAGLSKVTEERYPVLRAYLRRRMGVFGGKVQVVAMRWKMSLTPNRTI
jgi:peptidoglycan/LPS O-acetylase OafA/YrhL